MRTQGSLIKWNADRGFGFVKTRDSGIEVFAHISEFPRSGRAPQIGDTLHFDIATAQDGRKQAKAVTFDTPLTAAESAPARIARIARTPASRTPPAREPHRPRRDQRRDTQLERPRRERPRRGSSGLLSKVIVGTLLLGGAALGYQKFAAFQPPVVDMSQTSGVETTVAPAAAPKYACDGRQHCSQMHSCEEATWFLRHCPNTKMDGEGDGIPCEQQWCN